MSNSGILRRAAVVVITTVALGLAAGCASAGGHHTTTQSAGHPAPSTSVSASTAAARQSEAQHDAAHLLTSFRPPAGATRLAGRPPGSDALGDSNGGGVPNTVTVTSWWRVSGQPRAVVTHLATPDGGSPGDTWGNGDAGATMYAIEYDWPSIDVLVARSLSVQAARVGGTTVLRVDATSMWQPLRPVATLVPADAWSLVVSYRSDVPSPGSSARPAPRGPVTVTDRARIAAVAAEVNAAPVEPYGPRPCPPPVGELELSFRSAAGAEVANVQAASGGCDDIYVQVGTATATLKGAGDLTASVYATLHLAWAGK